MWAGDKRPASLRCEHQIHNYMEEKPIANNQDPLARIPRKLGLEIRYISFNVNGSKTIFNYHPWNRLKNSFNAVLQAMDGDIVSVQELKIQLDSVALFGLTKDYRAFILLPKSKKGYSGVGLYVRLPKPDDPPQVCQALTVVKAEEGITGRLKDSTKGVRYCDLPLSESIGGYIQENELHEIGITEQELLSLDSEGRCSMVELANNTVVFSLYCPANSMGTAEGQVFRLNFLEMMFRRSEKLRQLGKKVIVMGDINVSPDLIDSAESINELIKTKVIHNNLHEGGRDFERRNEDICLSFRSSTPHRSIFHRFVVPTLHAAPRCPTQFLFDTTRVLQQRKLALYTVWNTMTSARQSNFGSRIDLILISSEKDLEQVTRAEILPFLHGSDHCPIMTDICVAHQELNSPAAIRKLSFEAKTFYKLVKHHDISTLFTTAATKRASDTDTTDTESSNTSDGPRSFKKSRSLPGERLKHTKRKHGKPQASQQPIENFFFQAETKKPSEASVIRDHPEDNQNQKQSKSPAPVDVISKFATLVYDKPPVCQHNEECVLKTSKTPSSRGKKFWCCARISKGSTVQLGEHRCNFFEWSKKPSDLKSV